MIFKSLFVALFSFLASVSFADANTTSAATSKKGAYALMQPLFMVAFAVIFFYFILWRPEHRKRKEIERKRGNMKQGDKATAIGGIMGTVESVGETTVVLKMVDGSKIEFLKAAIAEVSKE